MCEPCRHCPALQSHHMPAYVGRRALATTSTFPGPWGWPKPHVVCMARVLPRALSASTRAPRARGRFGSSESPLALFRATACGRLTPSAGSRPCGLFGRSLSFVRERFQDGLPPARAVLRSKQTINRLYRYNGLPPAQAKLRSKQTINHHLYSSRCLLSSYPVLGPGPDCRSLGPAPGCSLSGLRPRLPRAGAGESSLLDSAGHLLFSNPSSLSQGSGPDCRCQGPRRQYIPLPLRASAG